MSGSVERVRRSSERAGLAIEIKRMGASTRTAEEAAAQCGCDVAQIVKSLIFEGHESGRLYLFLVPGDRRLDQQRAEARVGEALVRADARKIREETGFAIGGVSPLGHDRPIPTYADTALLAHSVVWAAAGAHDAVFSSEPKALVTACGAELADLT